MKTKLQYIILFSVLLFATSCDKEIDNLYKDKGRIQFKYYTLDYNKQMIINTKSTFSFGMMADAIIEDTAKIVVEFLGTPSEVDRKYKVKVAADSTTAIVSKHYKAIDNIQTFRAGKLKDTLEIVVYRSELSTSFTDPQNMCLALELEPSEDFDLGMKDGLRTYLYINNYVSEPVWWKASLRYDYIGFYHPKKWKILISFNAKFSDVNSCPFDINNEGRQYFTGLANYLNAIPTFDDETGDRIYIDRLVPQN